MVAVFQTPGAWVLAGGGAYWSAECRAAIAACGIDPDAFGTYQQRLDAQKAAREGYQRQRIAEAEETPRRAPGRDHVSGCVRSDPSRRTSRHQCGCHEDASAFNDYLFGRNGAPPNPNGSMQPWLTANAQSGHISGNAFYQDSGARGDPCANTRPSGYDPTTGRYSNTGGYGYQDDMAFCMDHYGRANSPGTAHNQITRREENQSEGLMGAPAQGTGFTAQPARDGINVQQRQIEQGVRGTVDIALRGADSRVNGDSNRAWDPVNDTMTAQQRANSTALAEVQRQNARQLLQREAAAGNVAAQQALAASGANGPSGVTPTDEQRQIAEECITAAWKKSLNEMRDSAINEHSTVAKSPEAAAAIAAHNAGPPPANPPITRFTDLPPERRAAVQAAVQPRVDARQHALEQMGAQSRGEKGSGRSPPTANDCMEYQANWLLNQRTSSGRYPPVGGSPQGTNGPPPFPPGQRAPAPTPPPAAPPTTV